MRKADQPQIERVVLYLFLCECRAAVDPLRELYDWYADALAFLQEHLKGVNGK